MDLQWPQGLAETRTKTKRLAQHPTEDWRAGNVGGWCHWWDRIYPQCGDKFAQVSHVRGVSRLGVDVLTGSFAIENSKLTIRPREYFIGRR